MQCNEGQGVRLDWDPHCSSFCGFLQLTLWSGSSGCLPPPPFDRTSVAAIHTRWRSCFRHCRTPPFMTGFEQMKSCGNNLALLRAAGWATWFGREVGALARVRQLDPCPASCLQRVGVRIFLGKQPKQGLRQEKRERKLHLLQFAQVPVGDTIIPTHWASLPRR